MNPILVGVALLVTVGAVVAVSAREARAALVGLAVALAAAPFLADRLPDLSTLAARVVGAALAAYLLRAALAGSWHDETSPRGGLADRVTDRARLGSRLGWPAEATLALAAWIVGLSVAASLAGLLPGGPGIPGGDPSAYMTPLGLVTAAGLASVVVGLVPTFAGRTALQSIIGALILLQGVLLVRSGVAGAPGDLEQLAGVALLVALGAAGAVLIGGERPSADRDHRALGAADRDWLEPDAGDPRGVKG